MSDGERACLPGAVLSEADGEGEWGGWFSMDVCSFCNDSLSNLSKFFPMFFLLSLTVCVFKVLIAGLADRGGFLLALLC